MGKLLDGIIKAAISGKVKKIAKGKNHLTSLAEANQRLTEAFQEFNELIKDPENVKELIRLGLWSEDDDDENEQDTNNNDQNS